MSSPTATKTSSGNANMASVTPVLSTTFVPKATTCTENRLTMLANRAFQIWMNAPVPVPGSTFTDCYPSQFVTSYLLSAGSVTQPAFNPLVCPQHYSAVGPYTSNYIACCPSEYSFAQPTNTPFSDRPAFGGTCYSNIDMATPVRVTAYGSSSATATSLFTATVTNAQAYAYPLEGFALGVAEVQSIPPGSTTTTSSSPSAAATHTVLAGTNPAFTPNSVSAELGDTVLFQFTSGNHSVTESTFDHPCVRLAGGFDSGYMPNINNAIVPTPEYSFNVSQNTSQWFYSKQAGECGNGMTFALNPSNEQTATLFQLNAVSQNGTSTEKSSGTSTGVKVGASIGSIAGVALILGLLFFLFRRRRQNSPAYSRPGEEQPMDPESKPPRSSKANTDFASPPLTEANLTPAPKGGEMHGWSAPAEMGEYHEPAELAQPPVEIYTPMEEHPTASPPYAPREAGQR